MASLESWYTKPTKELLRNSIYGKYGDVATGGYIATKPIKYGEVATSKSVVPLSMLRDPRMGGVDLVNVVDDMKRQVIELTMCNPYPAKIQILRRSVTAAMLNLKESKRNAI